MSGLPGTGKTRLALGISQSLEIPLLSKDRFQSQLRKLGLAGREGGEGYELMFDHAETQLSAGIGAVLDAVFPKDGFRERARELADRHRVPFRAIHCECSDERLFKERLIGRDWYVPDWTPVGWEEVERIRKYFQPWGHGSALVLDCVDHFEINLMSALRWIEL